MVVLAADIRRALRERNGKKNYEDLMNSRKQTVWLINGEGENAGSNPVGNVGTTVDHQAVPRDP